ncbi:hypothetical protein [Sediminicola luteus]|uniref:Uncharacterized protein n=1 Tax=Sediminicola luteus TaxID=319238 RepID=A0A2A4GE38_9FLAO|nr:hypothetical protein [Sediminicola luteus]PCE66268.1 hypothetical protein B7P33_02930 [Sediminicola luteus]
MELSIPNINGMLLGPFRLAVLGIGFFILYRWVTKKPLVQTDLDWAFVNLSRYMSILIVVLFCLVFLKAYDLFTIFFLFMVFLGLKYLDLKNYKNLNRRLSRKKMPFLVAFFDFIEKKPGKEKLWEERKPFWKASKNYIVLVLALVGALTFLSRYLFLKYDLYTLSGLWLKDLERVKSIDQGIFVANDLFVRGEPILIDFYAKITGISQEVALSSFGLLEHVGLVLMLYWLIGKLSGSKLVLPLFAVGLFAIGYGFLPLNINLLHKHNPEFLALIMAIPLMYFSAGKPTVLPKGVSLFGFVLPVGIAICATSIFIGFIIMPLFLLLLAIIRVTPIERLGRITKAYALGLVSVVVLYGFMSWFKGYVFLDFLLTNLIQVNTYTYFPQLAVTLDELLLYYDWMGWLGILLLLPLFFRDKGKWGAILAFMLFTAILLMLRNIDWPWFDNDILMQCLPWFLVLQLVLFLRVLGSCLEIVFAPLSSYKKSLRLSLLSLILVGVLLFNGSTEYSLKEKEPLKKELLKAYGTLSMGNLPYSYGVVNQGYGLTLAKGSHHYMGYAEFLDTYPKRDALYQAIKDDKNYLRAHPKSALPPSIFVFVSKPDASISEYGLVTPPEVREGIGELLRNLRKKGRHIETFFEDENLQVYEIVNKEDSSDLNALIFNL